MSLELPILKNGREINNLGSEFMSMQNEDMNNDLINPEIIGIRADNFNPSYNYNLSGITDPSIIMQNNENPNEELTQTNEQALMFIEHAIKNGVVTKLDKLIDVTEDFKLSPVLRRKLEEEAIRTGSNIFNHESQDFVNTIRKSIETWQEEKNLYRTPPQNLGEFLSRQLESTEDDDPTKRKVNDVLNNVFEDIFKRDTADKLREEQLRRRFVPRAGPSFNEQKATPSPSAKPKATPSPSAKSQKATPSPSAKPKATSSPSAKLQKATPSPSAKPFFSQSRQVRAPLTSAPISFSFEQPSPFEQSSPHEVPRIALNNHTEL